jgi:hypothetical protein
MKTHFTCGHQINIVPNLDSQTKMNHTSITNLHSFLHLFTTWMLFCFTLNLLFKVAPVVLLYGYAIYFLMVLYGYTN